MSLQKAKFYCLQCRQVQIFTREGTNHVLHLLLSFLLCGFWLPIWIMLALSEADKAYYCGACGYSNQSKILGNQERIELGLTFDDQKER